MSEEAAQVEQYLKTTSRVRRRAMPIFIVAAIIAAAVVLPPFINISRYRSQITALMTRSLGRPVRLSSVNLRLLPRPGFVLNDLSVGEAQEFGVEPILSAQTVVASIRLSALLTGKVEVDRISLDDASLNLVQSTPGRWNVEQIMMGGLVQGMTQTAPTASQPVFRRQPAAFPYLEAKNSRVNIKHGLEKLPYSLTNTQLSFWQESPGVWRLRLHGAPARTDMEISTGDTGDLRLEATLETLPGHSLYQMPLKVQADWREAQLGQLSRLLLGSDQGWRGDLTADLNVQGTLEAAQTEARLRATSVRREEFVPASPMDFDIHCGLLYQHTQRAAHNVACTTGIGSGKLELKADLPGEGGGEPQAALTVDSMPLQAGLDMLRTVRNGFAPGLSADGRVSGALQLGGLEAAPATNAKPGAHAPQATPAAGASKALSKAGSTSGANANSQPAALQGELTVADGALRGGALTHPLALPKITLTAAQLPGDVAGSAPTVALSTRFSLALTSPSGTTQPLSSQPGAKTEAAPVPRAQDLAIRLGLTRNGYQVGVNGSAPPERLRELAYALGVSHSPALDSLAGGLADVDSVATGPWLVSFAMPNQSPVATSGSKAQASAPRATSSRPSSSSRQSAAKAAAQAASLPLPGSSDSLTGIVHLHRVAWSAPYLARPVEFTEGMVNFAGQSLSASGSFAYGALSGAAVLAGNSGCAGCPPQIEIHLGTADAATIEGALLGAPQKQSLLSPLIDRMRNSQRTPWPDAAVKLSAESLALGPLLLHKPVLAMKLSAKELTLESWQADLLGGAAKGTGNCTWNGNQLAYTLEGSFSNLSGVQLGQLLEHPVAPAAKPAESGDEEQATSGAASSAPDVGLWNGGPVDGSGKVQLSGLTGKELASSAAGTLHFHWLKGTAPLAGPTTSPDGKTTAPTTPPSAPAANDAESASAKPSGSVVHFSSWAGDATIGNSRITLGSNTLTRATRDTGAEDSRSGHDKSATALAGSIPFGGPSQLMLAAKTLAPQTSAKAAAKP